jgi:hypothetical protein
MSCGSVLRYTSLCSGNLTSPFLRPDKGTDFKQVLNFLVVICLFNYSTSSLIKSYNNSTNSNSNKKAKNKLNNKLVQKKQKIDSA